MFTILRLHCLASLHCTFLLETASRISGWLFAVRWRDLSFSGRVSHRQSLTDTP